MKTGQLAVLVLLAFAGGCFVNEGDCETSGVRIEPCAVPAKVGQTRRLAAEVTNDPSQDVTWFLSDAAMEAFDVSFEGNTIQLISKLGVAGAYRLHAASAVDPTQVGDAVVIVGTHVFGYPPPPIQIIGDDFPADYKAAVAAGGDRYYVAYADLVEAAGLGAGATEVVAFVRQFDAETNQSLQQVDDAFELFGSSPVVPNVVADAQGNGYWVDFAPNPDPDPPPGDPFSFPRVRRLTRDGSLPEAQDLDDFFRIGPLAVVPDGTIYFIGDRRFDKSGDLFFRIRPFGSTPEVIDIAGQPFAAQIYDSMIADPEGRLLLGDENPDGDPPILRVLADPLTTTLTVDPGFQFENDFTGIGAMAVDAQGILYAVAPGQCDPPCDDTCDPKAVQGCDPHGLRDCVLLVDSRGRFVREGIGKEADPVRIECYEYQCPEGCLDARCGQQIPFDSISSISATPDGRVRIVDDVTVGLSGDSACQVQVRIVVVDP